jgi:thiamine biosynthesis lipoprotein
VIGYVCVARMSTSPALQPSRRRFLALAAGGCGAWLINLGRPPSLRRVVRQSKALGAQVTMTVLHPDEAVGQAALDAAFAELERVESVMSLYRPASQLSRLNRDGVIERPDPFFVEVLRHAAQVSELSGGAFDVTVQPLWTLRAAGETPDAAALHSALAFVNWRGLRIAYDRVSLMKPGMAITLNGIAQGFAADAAMRVVRAHGVQHALIDTGEMSAAGRNPEGAVWRIGIQHPRERDAFATLASLDNRCLATSGDYETTFSEDFSRHHIFDPHTGESPGEPASVSVLAPTAMSADALSTTLFVLGVQRGMELLRHYPGTDALMILKDGRRFATSGFPFAA